MKTVTIKQAELNEKNIRIKQTGYGHWQVSADYYGKRRTIVTTDSEAIDNFNSEFGEKKDGCNRRKQGYATLLSYIKRASSN
jgi:hypothetical protein